MEVDLALTTIEPNVEASNDWSAIWAASGAMSLSGRPAAEPLPVPVALVRLMTSAAARIASVSEHIGARVELDGPALLGERAAMAKLSRRGDICCGGGTRLVRAVDDWLAVSLARESDIELLPAWLEAPAPFSVDAAWSWLSETVASRPAGEVLERATLLGMPVSRLAEVGRDHPLVACMRVAGDASATDIRLSDLVVVDLSSLWAGPLCANVLGLGGARIIKVESPNRVDGARRGPAAFFDLLHGGHESVVLDLRGDAGITVLRALLGRADVVIDASRPRALAQMGIDPRVIASPRVWLSVTGHGRAGSAANRVAFGDDAAVAGGLITQDDIGPCFCCDAVADPVSGLVAAAAVLDRLQAGGRWLIDVALSRTAAWVANGPRTRPAGDCAPPRSRTIVGTAASLGEHTDSVIAEFGLSR